MFYHVNGSIILQ